VCVWPRLSKIAVRVGALVLLFYSAFVLHTGLEALRPERGATLAGAGYILANATAPNHSAAHSAPNSVEVLSLRAAERSRHNG
jgi:hypothetical protein